MESRILNFSKACLMLFFCLLAQLSIAQHNTLFHWWRPIKNAFPVIEGQAWPAEVGQTYSRPRVAGNATQEFSRFLINLVFEKVKPLRVYLIEDKDGLDIACAGYKELLLEAPIDIVCLGTG